ncbi:hypothetical protein [Chryseobacterium contaminans]|uniref:hypothetical protein n=1 Tax=Chryseobacterium contaminans TaxID=1423959 RepID=UPI0030174E49
MIDYEIEIQTAIKSNSYKYSDIFDFRGTPNETLFSQFYGFCRENLEIQSGKIKITPNFFIFSNEFSVNATAIKTKNGIYGIKINLGLFAYCINNILNNSELDNYIKNEFQSLFNLLDNPPSGLSFQIATQFTYYHELGHLMQLTKPLDKALALEERPLDNSTYNIENHKLEINADTYASIAIASHIQQYAENIFGKDIDNLKIESLIKILLSSLLNYIASFSDDLSNVYLDEKSHPHPFIRMFSIGLNVIHYLNQSPFLLEKNIKLNANQLNKDVFDFYEQLEKNNIYTTNFGTALDIVFDIREDIIKYLGELIDFNLINYNNALELWNKQFED